MARLIYGKGKGTPPDKVDYSLNVVSPDGLRYVFMWYVLPTGQLHLACNPELCAVLDSEDISTLLDKTAAALHNYVRQVG